MSPAGPAIARGPEKWSDMGLFYSYHLWVAQVSRPPALAKASGPGVGVPSRRPGRRAPSGRPAGDAGPS